MNAAARLRAIRIVHTVIWAFFAGCILAIPVAALAGWFALAWVLCAVVLVEVLILALNRMRCPLTDVAGRYTDAREPNFDIYLPRWLARHNKLIFGSLYALGVALTLTLWLLDTP
jgi:hypothetical protein